jgi:hypothetical protein
MPFNLSGGHPVKKIVEKILAPAGGDPLAGWRCESRENDAWDENPGAPQEVLHAGS